MSRSERLQFRNKKILKDLALGKTRKTIQEEYQLSDRQLLRIMASAKDELEEWYTNLSKEGMLTLFRSNSEDVSAELAKLIAIRDEETDKETKFQMTKDIINTIVSYNKMVAEGPVLTKYKELTDAMQKHLGKRTV